MFEFGVFVIRTLNSVIFQDLEEYSLQQNVLDTPGTSFLNTRILAHHSHNECASLTFSESPI